MSKKIKKMDGRSMDVTQEKIAKLRELFPEVVAEGKIDWEKLKITLGDDLVFTDERYVLNWAGKSDAFRALQAPTTATLVPVREESVNFDETENIFIEGENLEVLKVLQRSYFGKIKMIYIDPPYNTGKDSFIYPDKFSESKEEYLKKSGEKDEEGYLLKEGFFRKNSKDSGRYHSNWLSMMYPRLHLARNLLKEDGVIFTSIDDNEAHNLRQLMNEIFGEENFLAQLIWKTGHSAQAGIFKVYHQYVLVYAKNQNKIKVPKTTDSGLFEAGAMKRESKRHPVQKFTFPKGTRFDAEDGVELKNEWGDVEKVTLVEGRFVCDNGKLKEDVVLRAAWTQMNQMSEYFYGDKDNVIDSRGQKVVEFYFSEKGKLKIIKQRGVITPPTTLPSYGSQAAISTELASLFDMTTTPIDNPKSYKMIKDFIDWFTSPNNNDYILDFFAGSATTAHATLVKNIEDNGNRKFIMVQLPEKVDENTETFQQGYKTISDIGKERIRRVINRLSVDSNLGFKIFKLHSSNFKSWKDLVFKDPTSLSEQLDVFVEILGKNAQKEAIVYELLLKSGKDLNATIAKNNNFYSIDDGDIVLVLEEVKEETVRKLVHLKPNKIIALDRVFKNNDQLKTNTALQFEDAGIDFKTV